MVKILKTGCVSVATITHDLFVAASAFDPSTHTLVVLMGYDNQPGHGLYVVRDLDDKPTVANRTLQPGYSPSAFAALVFD